MRCVPSVPAAVARVLERALAKRPQDRYASAVQFAEALTAAAVRRRNADAAAPVAQALPPHNLPGERTHFIGRERELAECARLLGDTRVLTLTGIGGCGKTRLALKLAERMLPSFPDGVWFVDLAPVTDEEPRRRSGRRRRCRFARRPERTCYARSASTSRPGGCV